MVEVFAGPMVQEAAQINDCLLATTLLHVANRDIAKHRIAFFRQNIRPAKANFGQRLGFRPYIFSHARISNFGPVISAAQPTDNPVGGRLVQRDAFIETQVLYGYVSMVCPKAPRLFMRIQITYTMLLMKLFDNFAGIANPYDKALAQLFQIVV